MTTPDFEGFKTLVQVSEPQQGPKPVGGSANVKYDSKGREKKIEAPVGKDGKKPEEEQTFFSKYWIYILGAMFIVPKLLGGAEPEGAAGAGAGAGGAAATS